MVANARAQHSSTITGSAATPAQLEPYGWAAWSPAEGILSMRNPNEKEQTLKIDVGTAL